MRVCSRHFPDGDASKPPVVALGKRFCSPIKKDSRAKRAKVREERISISRLSHSSASTSRAVTPSSEQHSCTEPSQLPVCNITPIGEQYQPDVTVHELPGEHSSGINNIIALKARIEYLEAENAFLTLQNEKESNKHSPFRIEKIQHDDCLVRFYTGFVTFQILLYFFEFLGPVVDKLNYWGTKEGERSRHRHRKLSPINIFFLTLVKLRLNLRVMDLAYRFGLLVSQTSKYLTTWICFLYHHLQEIDWVPSVEQVKGTLPAGFKEKYSTTYAIIDASEIFMETPTDLFLQSSTWSQYKHHNTAKFLVACTPNGICFISPLYVGSISDIHLTKHCGFIIIIIIYYL